MSRAKSAIARLLGTTDPEVIKKVREVAKKQATERNHTEASDATTYKTRPIQVVPKEYDQAKAEAEAKAKEQAQEEALFHSYVMSPEWKEQYAIDQETKAEDAKRKQTADAYNAMSKLEDTFAAYEQSQDVAELFPGAKSESSTTWRDRVAQRKEGEAQAKAKVDQEREELRQRMQLLKDNPDAWEKSLEQPLQTNAPEVGLRSMESFANGKPVDKRGNVHDNWVSQAQANQRIDAEDKALQLGFQQQELQDMLADPMALDKEMSKLKAELAELTKQRDAYGSQFAKEHPWQMMANLMGRDSFDNPYEVGMYGVDAMETQKQMNNVIARINMLTEAKNAFERGSWSGHGFWNNVKNIGKGMQQFATEINSYTDKYNIESGMALNNLANKIERGEMLTDEEMSWFVTAKLKEEGEKAASQGPTTGAVGYGTPASLEYMVTMAINPARGASKTISDKIIEAGVRRFGKSAFTKMMAKATGMLTEGAVLSTTLGADNVASDALGRMAGKVGFDDGGNVAVADRVNPLKAMYQSTMASTIESAVEMMGVPIIGKATKGIGKVATKLADAMSYGKVSKLLSAMDKSQIVNWTKGMQKATGWHNLGEEWGEENVTMLTNAIIVGDNEIADMFDTRTQLEILGTCALISGVMSTANVAGFAGEFHKVNREFKKAKQEVLRQFSSDVWASLDNLITNAQDEDLTVRLADAMDGMAMNREQRSAIMNYLTALKRYQKFNELNDGGKFIIGDPQATQSTSTSTYEIDSDITLKDEIGNPIDAHIVGRDANGNYMVESSQPINGKRVQPMSADQLDAMVIPNTPDGIQQSEVDGYNLIDANQQAEVSMLTDNARESVATLLGVTPDAVDATLQQVLGDNPTDAKIDSRFGDNAQVVKDYMYNVAKTKGMSARLADDIADATAESDRAIDAVDNNGNVVTAKDAVDNDVNVVSGNIATYEDGLIDTNNSDSSVVIRHEDGTTEMVAPTSLTEVVSMPTEQAKATQAQAIAQQMQQAFSDRLNGALDYSQGQQYTMLNADGSTTDVTILADNGDGNVTVTARDGNKEGGVTDGKQIVLPKSQIQQGVREFKRNQLRGETAQQASIPQAEAQPTEVAEPTQEPSMPTDEQGNIMYEQMDADSAWDALLAETGGDADMAMTVANEMIADKTKAVEEASKMTPEVGATPQEKIANLKAVKQAQAQAQAELDAWKAIAETPTRRMSLQAEQAEQTESQGQQVADKLPASEEVTTETPTESESTPQVGLVEDARTRTLGDKTRKMLDAMAKRLGLQVEFVDEIVTGKDEKGRNLYANAVIVGKNVKIAWHNRNRAIDFLLGHEFTHRMQDLSPEAYAEFVEAAKQVLGEEEWNKRIKRMRDIYKSQGKTISEQGIIDEVVADYAGELVEERGVFDNFVERNKNNRGLLSAIADVLRSIKEFFTIGKQRKIDNAIARLEALIESASEANLRGDVVNMEKDRYSVSSIFEGTGAIVFNEEGGANIDKDGNFYVIINGKQYDGNNLITLDDIKADKRSVLNMMVEDAIKEGNVTEEHADVIMKKYVDIMNMFLVEGLAENGGYANMADKWMWVGETVYKTVQPNSDKQYTKSIDITTVCKKNEAVIRAMSEMQKRVGYGITPAQILDIYIETQQSGYQVPCPVCYVFSRYLRNGKYASGAILGMEQYGEHLPGGSGETWTADQWVAELRRLEDIDEDKTNKALYNQASADIVEAETMIDNLGLRLQQSNNEAERKELREQIEKADARYRAALNIFSQSALTSWIKTFAIQGSNDKGYKMRDDAQYPEDIELFKEHALDLRKAGETQTLFPAIQRLRNSGGSSTGKAVGFESNNALGDVISGIATGNNDTAYARASKATTEKEFETNRKKATENFKKASKYIKQQTLRGGQRMWSWSDNIEALMPDVVINLMQLELLGGALQTYSKQLEGVNLVARMGGYVNGSLMAKDNGYTEVTEDMIKVEDGKEVLAEDITETIQEPIVGRGIVDRTRVLAQAGSPVIEVNGKKYVLIFDDVIGIDPHGREVNGVHMKGLFDLNKELSKAGNIIVGMNDTHIRVGLADSRIFFIIPWHASGANNHILTEMFRVLGADISSMVSTDYTDMQSEKDYLPKNDDDKMPEIEQSVRDIWNAHKNETDWKCGVKGGIDSSKETISDSQKHYRELRQAIFDGELINNKAWLREVQADEFLSQVYDRVQSGTIGNSMTEEDNKHIYPYEYWDKSKTYDEADINGERYIEYCRRLGFSPKFSGIHGKKEYKNTGNFTNDKGYWKLLVDRRMYDIYDKFQDLDPVTSEDYTNELVHPGNTNKEFVISEVADAKATNKIVDRVIDKETSRTGTMPTVDYTLSHQKAYDNYKKEFDVMMADKAYVKANDAVSQAQAKLDALVEEGATPSRIKNATEKLRKAQEALQQAKKTATSAEKEAQKSRFSLTSLTEEEQRIVDEAKANGTYLKAPNGKASNLNERQWIQVRTKAFKDWFGDWENDPENASKVVDENGEPKVVYHGTAIGGFSIFGKAPKGIYFTDSRKAIDDYAWNGNKDVDNYFPFDPFADNQLDIVNKWLSEKDRGMMPKGTQVKEENGGWRIYLPDGTGLSTNFDSETMMMLLMEYATKDNPEFEGKGVYSTYLDMKNPFVIDAESKSWSDLPKTINGVTIPEKYMVVHQKQTVSTDEWAEFLQSEEGRKLGFDGMIIDNVYDSHTADGTITDYIAFEPTQIKSATDNVGTFDASNPDIRYSLASDMARDAVMTALEGAGIDVEMATPEMVEDVLRARDAEFMSAKKRRALETVSSQDEYQQTVVSSADGAKVLKNLDSLAKEYQENTVTHEKTFLGKVAEAIGAKKYGSNSQYATFETVNGKIVTIRLVDHNATVSNFDIKNESEGISIVVSAKKSEGIYNDGDAHIVEYYYDAIKLRKAEGKPLADIVKSIKQALYSGVFNDSTGLAEYQEVNIPEFHIAYHGSGAKFDEFDHSHMGEGEGAQAYGWGTYLTEVEGIAKMYAGANGATMLTYKGNELDTDGLLNQWRVIKDLYDENKGRLREMRNRAERILSLVEEDNTEMKQLWQSVVDTLKQVRAGDLKVKPKRNLYTVEIPDDTGKNYLDYDKEMSKKELNEVRNKLEAILAEGDYKGVEKELKRELDSVFVDGLTASDVYGNVSAYLGGDKQASEFFNEMGYVGIKYPANYRSGGNKDDKKNFVIFNDSDMKITDRVEFLQTPDGTVYGWTIGGKIFLTEQGMNAETPIHEYTHLWANAMRRNNEQGWESVKDLLRGTPMWDEVLADKNYSNIHDNEDLVASEVLGRYSGKENAKRLEDEAQRMISEAKGIGAKADAVSLINRVRRALQKFWDWVGKDLFGIKDFDSIKQVSDRVLYDLMNQTDLNAEVSEGDYGGERYSLVTNPATIEMLESAPKVSDSGVKLYRAMIEIDGKLYPPMSSMVEDNGEKVLREGVGVGDWVKSDEDLSKATLRNGKYYFDLLKDDGTSVDQVAYNPYLHTSDSMLNDQFKSAQSRPNLVVVEMEIPITGEYKAEGAKDAVGFVPGGWKSGDVATQLPTNRNVYLSQYGKPVRIVPTEEVAQHIYDRINGYVDVMPSNVVTPQVREALEKMGVQFVETDNQSVILEGEHKGKQWTHVYGKETIRKREEKSAKANAWVETTKQRLANAEAGLQKAKDNVAMLEQTEAEGMIGKAVGSAIEKAKEKVAKAEAKVAKAKATHEKAKSKVEPRYASRYSLSTGNIEQDNRLGKALYTINKEAKRLRDLKSEAYNQGLTDGVLKEIQALGGISKSFSIENGGVRVEVSTGGRFSNLSDVRSSIRESESEISELESKLQDEDLEDDERADIENDLEFENDYLDELRDIESAFEEYDAIDKYDAFSLFNERIDELYSIKEGVLNELIANGTPDGIHSFPTGDIRRVYKLGDYSFHGKDISDEALSEEEQNSIEDLEGISSENKLDDRISVKEALDVLSEYAPQKARYSLSADKAPTKLSKRAKKYKTEKIFGGIWIANPQEFAKFVVAVNRYAFEEDGEGITYTDKYFYAYYWNIEGEPIPFIRINLKAKDSREVIEEISKKYYNDKGRKRIDRYIHHALERFRSRKSASSNLHSHNSSVQSASRNGRLGSHLLRKGEYFDNRSLYVKTQRADRLGQEVNNPWRNLSEEQRTEIANNSQLQSLLYATSLWDEVADSGSYSNDDAITKEVLNHLDEQAVANANSKVKNAIDTFDKANAYDEANRLERALQLKQELVAEYRNESQPLFSLQGGRSIADKYEKKVNTKGKGGAMHLSKFNFMEALQDEMRALKEVQRITEQEYGIELESYEDAYKAENALSSVNQAEWERYIKDYYEPMMQIIDKWILKGGETEQSINHYLIAKSGLERNREFTVRDALAEMDKMDRQIINGAYSGTVLQLTNALRQGQISQDEYNAQVQDAKDKKNQALENIKNAQQARVDAYRTERDALREQLKNGDITYEEFNQLSDEVAIRHAKVEEIKDYSGLTALAKQYNEKDWRNFAEQMVVNFENKHDNTDVMWERINNATKKAVEKSYESGITSKEAKDHLDQMFLWYVPMGGMENDTAEDIYSYLNRNADSAFTQTVKRAEGHSEHISDDVMAMIANTMQSAILQGNRNKVKQKFLNMVQNYPTDLFTLDRGWVVMQGNEWVESHPEIKADYTPEQIREAIEKHDAEMRELEEQGLAMSKEGALKLGIPLKNKRNEQEHAISVMRNGEKMTIYVNGNPRVAQAVNGKLKATPAWELYETWKRWFSASKTSYSPNFIVSNASRDTGHTAMMTFVQRGLKEQLRALGTYIPAYATLVANAVGKKSPNGYKYDRYLEEFISNGGVTGYSQLYGVDKFKTDNAKRIARLKGAAKALQQGVNVVENINKIWQNINGIFENSSRFNEYIRSRNRGEDVATSVFNAKNITVNFNKKGGGAVEDSMFHQLAFVGRNWMPFFNPIVQGIYQFLKVGKEHKGRMALACLGFMGGGFLAPILNAMLVGALGGDDEDDYMKQPEWTRRNNFMIYTGDGYAKFALPQMFRELYGIGDILYCAIKDNMSAEDAAMQVVSQLRNMFSLEGQSSQKGKEWDALRFLAPDYFGAVVDIETNTNFTGAPLWKETDYNQYDPDYKKAYNNTWSWLVDFSQKVNEWTGGDEYSKGNVNNKYLTNPAVWQRLITEMGGGLTETIGDVYNTAYSLFTGQGIDTSNIPLVKRLYTETNDETLQKWIDREYYSLEGTHKYVKNRMSKLNKSSALDTADKISMMYYDRDYMVYAIYETYSKEIKELRDQAQSVPEDKKAEIQKREYDAKMKVISLIDNFNAIEDKEVEAYMANNPMVARLVGKDIIKKVGAKYKELKRNWKEAPYMSSEEKKAADALNTFEKTPEYQYYDSIRMATKAIDKKEEEIDTVLLPKNRLKIKAEIDSIKTQLVELRKAYESIGEVKE